LIAQANMLESAENLAAEVARKIAETRKEVRGK